MKKILVLLLLSCSVLTSQAQVRLPHIFGDNMVLQREKPIAVWGWANAKEKVKIQFHGQTKTAVADKNGKWKVSLDPEKAGGPYALTVSGKNSITIKNILVGEVWICSGQSNMEWPLRATDNATQEISQASYPNIRHIKIPNVVASTPKEDFPSGDWKICSPETAADFTAVGYYYAVKLSKELNVPVGLINTSWGGTHSETWTSRETFESSEEFKSMIADAPIVDVEEMNKQRRAEVIRKLESMQGNVNATQEEIARWKTAEYDDSTWPEIAVPALWEESLLPGVDGVVWLRKTITLPAADAVKPSKLQLAMIDDSDETYINGVRIGGLTAQYNTPRIYTIPANVLKAGKNVIAVRVTDTGGGGGIYGDPQNVMLIAGNRRESLAGNWKLRVEEIHNAGNVSPNDYPSLLFNAMLSPLIPYTMQGVIWYQGESNAGRAYQYRKAFPLMINDWRKHWNQGDFPFYFVQLASFNNNNGNSATGSAWAELREAQAMTLSLTNTGMAVTTDIGDSKDIHPRNKKDVGYRLAAIALADSYKMKIVANGPSYESLTIKGTQAVITFKEGSNRLATPDEHGYLRGFEIAGSDQKFYPAQAFIKNDQVIVQHEQVTKPVAVRYNWADDAMGGNLFNKEGFPAEPFRTDEWKSVTEGVRYKI